MVDILISLIIKKIMFNRRRIESFKRHIIELESENKIYGLTIAQIEENQDA